MDPKPVRRARPPGYPTKHEALEDPTLLERHMPPALRRGREIAGATALCLAMNFAACGDSDKDGAVVAPIFAHGEGRGVTGCVVVSPPVFLSEEEAIQVITEELGRHGLSFPERNLEVDSVRPPLRMKTYDWVEDPNGKSTRKQPDGSRVRGNFVERVEETPGGAFSMDARDPERNVGFEFVSRRDYPDLGGVLGSSTVQKYDLAGVSRELAESMAKSGDSRLKFGVFYDPMSRFDFSADEDYEVTRKRVEDEARELLKKQVADFVDWLKGQGAI